VVIGVTLATVFQRFSCTHDLLHWMLIISTVIKTTSDCDGDARSVGGGRGWLVRDTDGLASWLVTVGVVSQS